MIKTSISLVSLIGASRACINSIITSISPITFSLEISRLLICAQLSRISIIWRILLRSLLFTKNELVITNQLRSNTRRSAARSSPDISVIFLFITCSLCNVDRLLTTSSSHHLSVSLWSLSPSH